MTALPLPDPNHALRLSFIQSW
ncbi:hypothetical protein RS9917_07975 [Synechococcus sp. RS9917]|nr:hypothetical protein RS9917_07975 [Synechococcus sp. RS9917]